jgi:hypothetical protein
MKTFISLLFVVALAMACNKKNDNSETVTASPAAQTTDTISAPPPVAPESGDEKLYSCPMHPEVKGNKGDKCPKCQMELTETQP